MTYEWHLFDGVLAHCSIYSRFILQGVSTIAHVISGNSRNDYTVEPVLKDHPIGKKNVVC